LKFKTSRNQRLLVELCLMQLSSLTAQGEKKKANKLKKRFVLPPSHFKEIAGQAQEKLDTTQQGPVIAIPPIVQTKQTKEQENQNPCSTQVDKQETIQQPPPIKEEVSSKKRVSALSLKSIQKKQQLTKEINARIPNQKNLLTEDFTLEQMITHWNAYTEIVKGQGKYNFLSHLTMNEPKLKDGMIHLEFPNQTIKLEVERDKFELLTYMRKKLKNYNVDLVIDVNELQVKRYAYTDKEKYEKLVEKNPNLEALRNAFELDI
jgi:DNA polymerase-3 subunit gamma/tau